RAQEALRRRSEQLQILSRAAHQVNSVLQITTVMRTLVRSAMELVEGTGGMAGLVRDGYVVFDEHHRGDEVTPLDLTFAIGHGVAGHVVKTARPYISDDAANDPVIVPDVQQRLDPDAP